MSMTEKKNKQYNVAVVGATGVVGECILEILAERQFPVDNVYPLASENSAGGEVVFGKKKLPVGLLSDFDFNQCDLAFFTAGASVSAEYAPRAAACGCVVIDNTSHFRNDPEVPLIVPEVNPHALEGYERHNIIANPNCSTIQMLVALKPIEQVAGIRRIDVASYQSVSGAGKKGIEELAGQTAALLNFREVRPEHFPVQIAFNVMPHIDSLQDNGFTREEMKMVWETRKILERPDIQVNPTCVRVPVFYAHSEAVHIETNQKITAPEARKLLEKAPGVQLVEDRKRLTYPTPVDATGKDPVFVGRIRESLGVENGLDLWVVADNIRKGAALNSVQIAELLVASACK